jgi:hypothetical protein
MNTKYINEHSNTNKMSNKYLRAMRNTLFEAPDKTPFCGTCHKAGLSREEYTSHWTRKSPDPNSEVVCPLILDAICSNCKTKGHWKKYCPELEPFSRLKQDRLIESKRFAIFEKSNTFISIANNSSFKEQNDLIIEDYRSSDEVLRPSSPDFPPPWLDEESQPKPIKKSRSWAEVVATDK